MADARDRLKCPFCDQIFGGPVPEGTPLAGIGRDFRDHLTTEHPVQEHDLATTRWHDGLLVRCEPAPPMRGPRLLPKRKTPPPGHGLLRLIPLDERESDQGPFAVFCTCGFRDVAPSDKREAFACLHWHWARSNRLACPFCQWTWESDLREEIEREMARHIGMQHPERFPWGYQDRSEPTDTP